MKLNDSQYYLKEVFMLTTVKISFWLLYLCCCSAYAVSGANYNYPIKNAYAATIIGTPDEVKAELPDLTDIPIKHEILEAQEDRNIPDVFWYEREGLRYDITLQDKKAPLIFAIAGTGASQRSDKMTLFQRAFYKAGFHVVSISSPTFSNFMVNASQTGIPGNLSIDAEDIYTVMQRIMNKYPDVEVSQYHLVGYSLGASHAAHVAYLDEQKQFFRFKKVLMINPPLSLVNSVKVLDRMLNEHIPGGLENFPAYFEGLMTRITEYYKTHESIDVFSQEFFYRAYQDKDPSDHRMQALIGSAFRLSSSNIIFFSDVYNNLGYIVPKNTVLTATTSLMQYGIASRLVGFSDYIDDIYLPYYSKKTGKDHGQLIAESSLNSLKDYLMSSEKISLMHNENDPILGPGEIETLKNLFPERAIIYPYGGHCGNMEYTQNVSDMTEFFTGGHN